MTANEGSDKLVMEEPALSPGETKKTKSSVEGALETPEDSPKPDSQLPLEVNCKLRTSVDGDTGTPEDSQSPEPLCKNGNSKSAMKRQRDSDTTPEIKAKWIHREEEEYEEEENLDKREKLTDYDQQCAELWITAEMDAMLAYERHDLRSLTRELEALNNMFQRRNRYIPPPPLRLRPLPPLRLRPLRLRPQQPLRPRPQQPIPCPAQPLNPQREPSSNMPPAPGHRHSVPPPQNCSCLSSLKALINVRVGNLERKIVSIQQDQNRWNTTIINRILQITQRLALVSGNVGILQRDQRLLFDMVDRINERSGLFERCLLDMHRKIMGND